ncbi:MAG: beta-1,3-glucanase family protein [Nakamurella sp.]
MRFIPCQYISMEALMLNRRTLLGGAALAAAAPLLAGLPAQAAAAPSLAVDLVNRRSGESLYAHFMGLDHATGRWFFLAADARTRVYPGSPTSPMTPLSRSVGIPLAAAGTRKSISIPAMDSGRVYFSVGRALKFFVNPGGGIVTPSVANPADANADLEWAFCELTFDANGLYANISFVDFVSVAIGLTLDTTTGQQTVGGLIPTGLQKVATGLTSQAAKDNPGWRDPIVSAQGKVLRVLSPNLARELPAWTGRLEGYLNPYIAQCWQKYRSTDLRIDTQSMWGKVTGRVGSDGVLRFPGIGGFAQPSSAAVFNCSIPPFVTTNDAMGNLTARLAAALNRGTLLANANQPDATSGSFYRVPLTNHYARLIHSATTGGAGYAFPYDDVHSDGYNTEGRVVDQRPTKLTIRVG